MTKFDPAIQGDTFDPATVIWVHDDDDLARLIEAVRGCSEIVTDLETTGLNEYETGLRTEHPVPARISLASFTLPQLARPEDLTPPTYVLSLSHPQGSWIGQWRKVLTQICKAIVDSGKPITNHNLKFDMKWIFATTGVDLSHLFAWDTMISSHLLDENESTKLKERAPALFGIPPWNDFDLSKPGASEKVPLLDLGFYAARDTYWTWRLAVLHRTILGTGAEGEFVDEPFTSDEVTERRVGALAVRCSMPTSATLSAIEQRGMRLDLEWVQRRLEINAKVIHEEFEKLVNRYPDMPEGDPSFAATSKWFQAWSTAAVAQDDLRITALTPTGKPQWSKAVLTKQARHGNDIAQSLLNYRAVIKENEFLNSWTNLVSPNKTIHTTYWASRVLTGRLSSQSPNMQQINKILRQAFIPRPGYYIADLDYSQIELRAAAHVAQCRPMIEAFERGDDLHTLLAATITGKMPANVTPAERQAAKAGNFGFLFGMAADGFRTYAETTYGVEFTADEAQIVHDAFFSHWAGMENWHNTAVARAYSLGEVVSPIGRVRRLPDIHDGNPAIAGHAERQAINSPVQSFASDMMQMAAASIEGNLPGHDALADVRIVATVHDSIVVEVPVNDWQRATGRAMRRMIDVSKTVKLLGCDLRVPLKVEAAVGTRWGLSDVGIIK